MAVRMDIELTSSREDGTWTWRAAGARQPKGALEGSLLFNGAKVGDVVRAEAEVEIDGITITAVLPPKTPRAEPSRLEVLGPPPAPPSAPRPEPRPSRGESSPSGTPGPARRKGRGPADDARPRRSPAERAPRPVGSSRSGPPQRSGPSQRSAPPQRDTTPAPRPKAKRLNPGRTHRDAVLATLEAEQLPIAEQLLRGGMPAVRAAVKEQNARARESGAPEIKADMLFAIAEELLPRVRAAEWRDRAEAAVADIDEIGLRDLRAVVAGADAAKDDDARALANTLREGLERRRTALRQQWVKEVSDALDEGRLVRALRVSARPPEPAVRLPLELANRLSAAAGGAMAADVAPDRWAAILEAVAASPVRTSVRPAALPAQADEAALNVTRTMVGRVPGLGPLLGFKPSLPPPPPRRVPPPPPSRPPDERAGGVRRHDTPASASGT